nr:hypothetical protein [Tanacetum cinerariifolium]
MFSPVQPHHHASEFGGLILSLPNPYLPGVESYNNVRRPKSKDNKSKDRVLKNTNVKRPFLDVQKMCSKHMTGNLKLLRNFVKKFIGTVHFRNDHFAAITGYGDYVQGNIMICHNSEGGDLLTGSRESNIFTISIFELAASSPLFLMSKATSTKSWLWHRRLSHLNFGTVNQLTSKDLVDGLPKFKSMRVESFNGKKYILVIVDDYSRYTWIQTDNGTEFKNEKLRSFYAKLGIIHHTSIARMPQAIATVFELRNHTLVEAARTMLIISKTLEFLWAEAITTVCFT